MFCKRSYAQRSEKCHLSTVDLYHFFGKKKTLGWLEDHTFHNKLYDNVGVDSYLQPTGAWVLAFIMETALLQKSRWEKKKREAPQPVTKQTLLSEGMQFTCPWVGFIFGLLSAWTPVHFEGAGGCSCSLHLSCFKSFHSVSKVET